MSSSAEPPAPSPGERSSPRWSRLLSQTDDRFFVLNARRKILYVNPAWERWAGLTLPDVRGLSCRPSSAKSDDAAAILNLFSPTKEALAGLPSRVRRRGAAPHEPWIDVHFFPCSKDGKVSVILGRVDVVGVIASKTAPPLPEKIVQLRERATRLYRLELWESGIPAVQRVVAQARLASQNTAPILLQGPVGAGKEWLARTIHHLGPRREEFFAGLDAQRLPPALIADFLLQSTARLRLGAMLIRHPGSLRPEIQSRLSELLAAEEFGPRLFISVADPGEANTMIPELLARVSVQTILAPALHERRADWSGFLPEMLARAAATAKKSHATVSPEAEQALRGHSWPGNFRELDQTLRDALLHAPAERIELADLPFELRNVPLAAEPKLPLDELLEGAERRLIKLALEQAGDNKSKAAQLLGIWRPRLLRRMEQLGFDSGQSTDGDHPDA
jgi:PAS domain S-box-containing protein